MKSIAVALMCLGLAVASAGEPRGFGNLEPQSHAQARAQALAWLKAVAKADAAPLARFEALWKQTDRPVIDLVADTLALGDAAAAKLLAEARDPLAPAPVRVPEILQDKNLPAFFRANLALAYGRALSQRRVHEEALATFKSVRPEDVVDPAALLFHRAICEHALLLKDDAARSIGRLIDATAVPERYKVVAALMFLDMQTWKEKDLAAVARRMENIERRLDLARGGPQTQKLQKEVIFRLDELIKELENKRKGDGPPGDGPPGDGPPKPGDKPGSNPTKPLDEPRLGGPGGTGQVDAIKIKSLIERWGILPPREQARALQELTRGMSPRHREAIENYFRNIAQNRP